MITKENSLFFSILFGLGLAAVFKKACKNNSCLVIQGPAKEDINKYVYKVKDDCYKYSHQDTKCEELVHSQK